MAMDRGSFSGQDQENGLKGIVCVVDVAEQPAADALDQRPMPPHQDRKRPIVVLLDEPFQEELIRQISARGTGGELVNVMDDGIECGSGHDFPQEKARFSSRASHWPWGNRFFHFWSAVLRTALAPKAMALL